MSQFLTPKVLYPGNQPTVVIPNSTINLFYQNRYTSGRGFYMDKFSPYAFVPTPRGVNKVKMSTIYPDALQLRGTANLDTCKYKPIGGSFMKHSEINLCGLYHYSTSCPDKYNSCLEFTLVNGQYTATNLSMINEEAELTANVINESAWTYHLLGKFFTDAELALLPGGTDEAFLDAHSACQGIMSMIPKCSVITKENINKAKACKNDLVEALAALEEIYGGIECCADEHSDELNDALIDGITDPSSNITREFQFIVSKPLWSITLKAVRSAWHKTQDNKDCPESCTKFEFYREGGKDLVRYNGYDIVPEPGFNYWDKDYIGKKTYAIIGTVQGNIGFAGRVNPLSNETISGVTPVLYHNNAQQAAAIVQDGIGLIYGKKPGLDTREWEMLYNIEVGSGVADVALAVSDIQFF